MTTNKGVRNVSIILSLSGGFLGILFGFTMLMLCNLGWIGSGPSFCVYLASIIGISFLVIIGALIEFRSVIIGSIICVIIGVIGIIISVMITMILAYPTLFLVAFFSNLAGGVIGLCDYFLHP
ncbi:MAG: hypothetical protein ACFFCG_06465 [Promethearchaeota archaeon]